jgi:hypothetical protein
VPEWLKGPVSKTGVPLRGTVGSNPTSSATRIFAGTRDDTGLSWLDLGVDFKRLSVPTEADHIKGVRAPGRYDATVGSEAEARRIVRGAMPDAVEVPPAVAGQLYPLPDPGVNRWYQVHPAEPQVGNHLPHIKYQDWTGGKKKTGGSWGHIFFPQPKP